MPRYRSRSLSSSRSRSSSRSSSSSRDHRRHSRYSRASSAKHKSKSGMKAPLAFLGTIAAAALCAHHYWPKGIIHGGKEDWELAEVKNVKRKLQQKRDRLRDDIVGPRYEERSPRHPGKVLYVEEEDHYDRDRGWRDDLGDRRASRRQRRFEEEEYAYRDGREEYERGYERGRGRRHHHDEIPPPPVGYVEYPDRRSRSAVAPSRRSYDESSRGGYSGSTAVGGGGNRSKRYYDDEEEYYDDREARYGPPAAPAPPPPPPPPPPATSRRYSVDERRYDAQGNSEFMTRRERRRREREARDDDYY